MKKTLIAVLFTCFFLSANAQKIVMDKVEDDGKRYIHTEDITIVYAKTNFVGIITESGVGMALCCVASDTDTIWGIELRVGEKVQIDEERKLLIKLSDNSIITLENVKQIGSLDYEAVLAEHQTIYLVYPLYYISREEIQRMMQIGVEKIRIETNVDYIDRVVKWKTMKDVLRKELDNIETALRVKKDIYSDF